MRCATKKVKYGPYEGMCEIWSAVGGDEWVVGVLKGGWILLS